MIKEMKKYKSVILVLLFIIILVGIRQVVGNHFKHGAVRNAIPALSGISTMDLSQVDQLKTNALLVYLDEEAEINVHAKVNSLHLKTEELLSRQTIKKIKKAGDPIILVSDDPTLTARAWMLLAQKGIKNIYSLTGKEETEKFRYKFQPDTVSVTEGPEFK